MLLLRRPARKPVARECLRRLQVKVLILGGIVLCFQVLLRMRRAGGEMCLGPVEGRIWFAWLRRHLYASLVVQDPWVEGFQLSGSDKRTLLVWRIWFATGWEKVESTVAAFQEKWCGSHNSDTWLGRFCVLWDKFKLLWMSSQPSNQGSVQMLLLPALICKIELRCSIFLTCKIDDQKADFVPMSGSFPKRSPLIVFRFQHSSQKRILVRSN